MTYGYVYLLCNRKNGTIYLGVKTMKGWPRQWKINTIETDNPNWDELVLSYDD